MSELVSCGTRAYPGLIQIKVQLVRICGSSPVGPPLGSLDRAHVTAALAQALFAMLYGNLNGTDWWIPLHG